MNPEDTRPVTTAPEIPDHELLKLIGRGSYGEVWLARNVLGEYRAVKVVYRNRFEHDRPYEREFEGIQKFEPISRTHESQVDILHVGRNQSAGYFYYVMELADGEEMQNEKCKMKNDAIVNPASIGRPQSILNSEFFILNYRPHTLKLDLYQRTRLPVDECIQIGLELTTALEHLHSHGLVHRDIKPSNIIFVNGTPKLADIGLVASMDATMSFVGTSGFLPPEGPGTPQGDLYSLGKVLYEISMGRDRQEFPKLPANLVEFDNPQRLLELNAVILKACQTDPRKRYQSAQEMAADLALLQRGQSVKCKQTRQRRWATCKRASLLVIVLASVTAVILAFLHTFRDSGLHSAIPEVNSLIAQGNLCLQSSTPERLRQAWDFFSKAVELDPKFALTYVGRFRVRLHEWGSGFADSYPETIPNLRAAATKLIEMAPSLAEAQIASAHNKYLNGHLHEALADAQRAAHNMRPGSKEGRGLVGFLYGWYLMHAGDPKAALREYLLAERADPASPRIQIQLGHAYFVQRNFKEALKRYEKSLVLEQRQYQGYSCSGDVYEELLDFPKAIQAFEKGDLMAGKNEAETKRFYDDLRDAYQQGGAEGYWSNRLEKALSAPRQDLHGIATFLAHLGKTNEAYEWLEKACNQDKSGLWLDVCWDHGDERFKAIAKKRWPD